MFRVRDLIISILNRWSCFILDKEYFCELYTDALIEGMIDGLID